MRDEQTRRGGCGPDAAPIGRAAHGVRLEACRKQDRLADAAARRAAGVPA
jgi:hypothetical protein